MHKQKLAEVLYMSNNMTRAGSFMMQAQGGRVNFLGTIFNVFAIILMIAVTVYVVMLIIELIKKNHINSSKCKPQISNPISPALAILTERLAKGEISEEDYQRIKAEILK